MEMKKSVVINFLAFALLSSVACSGASGGAVKEVVIIRGDRNVYGSLNMLLEPVTVNYEGEELTEDFSADLVVIGEFTGETKAGFGYVYDDHFKKEIINDANAYNQLLITNVLKGDAKVGETVTVVQRYGFDEERGALISFSGLTPMNKGDSWIYFLKRSDNADFGAYYSAGDSDGRYPVPNHELKKAAKEVLTKTRELHDKGSGCGEGCLKAREEAVLKIDASMLGVLNRDDFNFELYAEILEYFEIGARDGANPGQGFDAGLIELANRQ
ncbi:MAG: hypothetical protein LBI38_03515 [Oscillospiraceae bacterium]|jgi:hypothetical protein|nr:hypothetical protein [Oscillospiraceae bacterium]